MGLSTITEPRAGDDSRTLWRVVASVVKAINGFIGIKLVPGQTWKADVSESNVTITYVDLLQTDIAIPTSALPIQLRKVKACDDDGTTGWMIVLASDFFTDSST